MVAEFDGCHAKMLFDILAEKGSIGESQSVTDLLDAEVSLFQAVANVLKDMLCNPLTGSLA